jgi:hypothetical protein
VSIWLYGSNRENIEERAMRAHSTVFHTLGRGSTGIMSVCMMLLPVAFAAAPSAVDLWERERRSIIQSATRTEDLPVI